MNVILTTIIATVLLAWNLYMGYHIYVKSPNNFRPGEKSAPRKATKPYWAEFLLMNTILFPFAFVISFKNGILRDDLKKLKRRSRPRSLQN